MNYLRDLADAARATVEAEDRVDALLEVLAETPEADDSAREFVLARLTRRRNELLHARSALAHAIDDYQGSRLIPGDPFLDVRMPDDTLGSIAQVLRQMLDRGITEDSIRYALSRA